MNAFARMMCASAVLAEGGCPPGREDLRANCSGAAAFSPSSPAGTSGDALARRQDLVHAIERVIYYGAIWSKVLLSISRSYI